MISRKAILMTPTYFRTAAPLLECRMLNCGMKLMVRTTTALRPWWQRTGWISSRLPQATLCTAAPTPRRTSHPTQTPALPPALGVPTLSPTPTVPTMPVVRATTVRRSCWMSWRQRGHASERHCVQAVSSTTSPWCRARGRFRPRPQRHSRRIHPGPLLPLLARPPDRNALVRRLWGGSNMRSKGNTLSQGMTLTVKQRAIRTLTSTFFAAPAADAAPIHQGQGRHGQRHSVGSDGGGSHWQALLPCGVCGHCHYRHRSFSACRRLPGDLFEGRFGVRVARRRIHHHRQEPMWRSEPSQCPHKTMPAHATDIATRTLPLDAHGIARSSCASR
eukprot:m.1464723 g.1464723  ORF g.1464723 m.1464723 type:complete len:332 (+) comp25135_c0_seq8:1442-2437(+)